VRLSRPARRWYTASNRALKLLVRKRAFEFSEEVWVMTENYCVRSFNVASFLVRDAAVNAYLTATITSSALD